VQHPTDSALAKASTIAEQGGLWTAAAARVAEGATGAAGFPGGVSSSVQGEWPLAYLGGVSGSVQGEWP
jgi:hypothetical protein